MHFMSNKWLTLLQFLNFLEVHVHTRMRDQINIYSEFFYQTLGTLLIYSFFLNFLSNLGIAVGTFRPNHQNHLQTHSIGPLFLLLNLLM